MTLKTASIPFFEDPFEEISSQNFQSGSMSVDSLLSISDSDVADALAYTGKIIDRVGPRLAGTKACHKSASMLFKQMQSFADHSHLEKFAVHPESFLSFLPVISTAYVISSFLLMFGGIWVYFAIFGYIFGFVYALLQFVFYEKFLDPLYKKMTGYNISGVIEPTGSVKQQIIISGHHDSAFVFNFLQHNQKWYTFRLVGGLLTFVATMVFTLIWAIYKLATGNDPLYADVLRFAIVGLSVLVIQFYFFKSRKGTPGAGDNLIASVMAMKVGKKLAMAKKMGISPLENTRVVILSNDAEEAGLRGAAAYVKQHYSELKEIPTYNFNVDSIYNVKELQFLTSDINGTVLLSKAMAEEALNVATKLGYPARILPIPFGGGATDAAEFAKIGVEATTLLGLPTEHVRDGIVYHTTEDKVENIEPAAVKACLEITMEYVLMKERQLHQETI